MKLDDQTYTLVLLGGGILVVYLLSRPKLPSGATGALAPAAPAGTPPSSGGNVFGQISSLGGTASSLISSIGGLFK